MADTNQVRTKSLVMGQFFTHGPFIATSLIVFYAHIFMALTTEDFLSKVSLGLLPAMLVWFVIMVLVGYLVGAIPAIITGAVFYHLLSGPIGKNLNHSTRTLLSGGLAGMMWVLIGLIIDLMFKTGLGFTVFSTIVMIPTAILCAYNERQFLIL